MHRYAWIMILTACGDTGEVAGKMSFVQGGTSASPMMVAEAHPAPLTAGDSYIVSPRKAKITFTSVEFRDESGNQLGTSELADCVVTYDRSQPAGSTLLDCPMTLPVGEAFQMKLYFSKQLEVLISDTTNGIYSDPSAPSGYTTTPPATGAGFVPYTIMIGDGTSRATDIIFSSPVTIAADTPPQLFVTTDMIQTFQIMVDSGGTSLTAHPGNDPIALFAGLSAGSSRFFSNAGSIESYKIGSVDGFHALRIFYDAADKPLFLMSPNTCGPDGPKGAWASPPIGATIGGWLGTDANNLLAWAQPKTNTYQEYTAYYVMTDVATLGQGVNLKCKATSTPPPPADGKTYASGAPEMPTSDVDTALTLLTK
jgi:hypothetical protein